MSQNTDQKDKLILDTTDSADMQEHFSRLNPGDEVSGTFKATLDEAGQKTIVCSISEITIDQPEEEESPDEEAGESEGEEASEDSAAVKMMKSQEGVPSGEDNMPPESVMAGH